MRIKKHGITALAKAREGYRKRGDANSSGDWLAVALKDVFSTEDGGFRLGGINECLKENSIEPPQVDMQKHGAVGRFRMVAGIKLRGAAKKNGFVID
jgi:hypothetical protein